MEKLSVIPRMPKRFDDVDTEIWAAEALCMLQNADWNVRPHYLVGIDEHDTLRHTLAFHYVMRSQGVPLTPYLNEDMRQAISGKGLQELDNVFPIGKVYPDSFFDLMRGAFAVPMGDTIDAISDAYDAGFPIYIIKLKFQR